MTASAGARQAGASPADDGHLAQRHVNGDPQAFGALVDRYQTRLLAFITRTIGDQERAEDLVQDVFIRVFRRLHRFDWTKKFSTWIYAIASNAAKAELRGRGRNPAVLARSLELEELPEALRDVFVLRELEGMSYTDIAEITCSDVGTVRSRLSLARRRVGAPPNS